jgi:hypothetical protein
MELIIGTVNNVTLYLTLLGPLNEEVKNWQDKRIHKGNKK